MSESKTQRVADEARWYALRVFKGHIFQIKKEAEKKQIGTYMAMRMEEDVVDGHMRSREVQIVPSLLFVHTTAKALKQFKELYPDDFMIYRDRGETEPTPIREKEMELFMYITSTDHGKDIECYEGPVLGDQVEVTDGIYKGARGVVKRIKRDRKLLVVIEGVAVVAISNIPISYLKKI